MHVPLTIAALALLTAVIVLIRICWSYLSPATHRILITTACVAIAIYAITSTTHWQPTNQRLGSSLRWFGIAAYEFFIILLTLLRPRLFTSFIAAVLILPLLSASILLPLSAFFDHLPQTTTHLPANLVSVRTIVDRGNEAADAADLEVFRIVSWFPFLEHRIIETRFFATQCDAANAFATIQPDRETVVYTCPALPTQPPRNPIVERHRIH